MLLVSCSRTEYVTVGPGGSPLINSVLVGETQGCQIYSVDTSSLPVRYLYLTKCNFDKTSSASVNYQYGKSLVDVPNSTVK